MQTYAGIARTPVEDEAIKDYIHERMEAAVSILERIISQEQDMEDELQREMDRKRERRAKRKQNLMMAGMAMEKIRAANGQMLEQDFSQLSNPRLGGIYKTPYGMVMSGIKEVLEKFWTGE